MAAAPFGLTAYRLATMALAPAIPLLLRRRARRGKEDEARMGEKLGHASVVRPEGTLVWIHGASVGECVAALPLVDALLKSNRAVLVTSGTVTSGQLMAQRLPGRAIHQYAPLDTPAATRRFLDYWKPSVALFVDSEIWPNILRGAHARGVRLAMVNGRMSERSFIGWRRAPRVAAALLSLFDVCLAQDAATARRLTKLGAPRVTITGSLKADAPPLPADMEKLNALRAAIGNRPVLLAASTHPGEDETILPAQDILRREFADLLTIIAPRHPERGTDIAMLCGTRSSARRSQGEIPARETEVYIADTIGELGLLYRVAPFAFIGGSLIPHGGQNPLEAAHLGCAVLAGTHTENFAQAYNTIFAAQGTGRVSSAPQIADMAKHLIANPAEAKAMGEAAAQAAAMLGGAVEKTLGAVEALLVDARA
jgi:3-deoxy-D-manno-octulosonic-acid transferase